MKMLIVSAALLCALFDVAMGAAVTTSELFPKVIAQRESTSRRPPLVQNALHAALAVSKLHYSSHAIPHQHPLNFGAVSLSFDSGSLSFDKDSAILEAVRRADLEREKMKYNAKKRQKKDSVAAEAAEMLFFEFSSLSISQGVSPPR